MRSAVCARSLATAAALTVLLSACAGTPAALRPEAARTTGMDGYLNEAAVAALADAVPPPPVLGSADDLDDKARASLIAGADLIRDRVGSETPADVAATANRFLDSTGRLGAAIGKRQLSGLNPIAAQWTRDKQAMLNSCSGYLPVPPTAGASPAPAPGEQSPGAPPTPSVPPSAPPSIPPSPTP